MGGVDCRRVPHVSYRDRRISGSWESCPSFIQFEGEKRVKMSEFPEIQGGGSLIVAWQVKNKHVLVVGGGEVSCMSYPHRNIY